MNPSNGQNDLRSLPVDVEQRLLRFQSIVRRLKTCEAIAAGLFGFLLAYWMIFALDRVWDTSRWARLLLLVSGSIGFAVYLPYMLHRWVWRTRHLESVAKLLKYRFPQLSDQVLSIVELAKNQQEQKRSPRLIAAAMEQVDNSLKKVDVSQGVPRPRLRAWTMAFSPFAVLACIAIVVVPAVAWNSWQRYLMPWADIERYTFARPEKLPPELYVPYAEPFSFSVKMREGSDWIPQEGVFTVAGKRFPAKVEGAEYAFRLPGQLEASDGALRVGDATQRSRIVPTVRPEIVQLGVQVQLPEYLQYDHPIELEARGASLPILRGSEVVIRGRGTRALASGKIESLFEPTKLVAEPGAKADEKEPSAASDSKESPTAADPAVSPSVPPVENSEDSARQASPVEWRELATRWREEGFETESFSFEDNHRLRLEWTDLYGLSGSKPVQLMLRGTDDSSPVVSCSNLPDPLVLLVSDTLTFQVQASDDFGLKHIGLEWKNADDKRLGKSDVHGERLVLVGKSDSRRLAGQATLSCTVEKIEPQTLELRAFTEDYLPGRGRVYSPPYLVRVMSAEEHAQWIGEQLRRWKGKADALFEEENRLFEENKQLQSLSSRDMDSVEARNRMAQQQSAERNNAQRLQSLAQDGKKLLEQALQNEEIRAKQIEQWAKSLQTLNKLSGQDMPELADMIGRTAESPKASNPSESDGKPMAPKVRDDETSPYDKEKEKEGEGESGKGGGSRLTIPETQLGPTGGEKKEPSEEKEESPAKKKMDEVVKNHQKLLDEFRKARQAFDELMTDFENSTFIKRLKAASRFQREIATELSRAIGSNFGRPAEKAKAAQEETDRVVGQQKLLADKMSAIQTDLAAYQNNNPAASREAVLKEMKEKNLQIKLEEMPARIERNLRGDALNRSEFWADTFDRWAEELAGPGGGGGGGGGGEKDSLPPALLLEIMRIISDEMDLRDETRTLNQMAAPENQVRDEIEERTAGQAVQQMAIQERTLHVIEDIQALPNAGKNFGEELGKLNKAVQFMDDASGMLSDLRLGEEVLAAETAAIEALIEAKRGGGGGGGGGDSPGGGGTGDAPESSPLDLVGPGSDAAAKLSRRQVGEGTGKTGRVLPEQYRQGLDRFLNRAGKNR